MEIKTDSKEFIINLHASRVFIRSTLRFFVNIRNKRKQIIRTKIQSLTKQWLNNVVNCVQSPMYFTQSHFVQGIACTVVFVYDFTHNLSTFLRDCLPLENASRCVTLELKRVLVEICQPCPQASSRCAIERSRLGTERDGLTGDITFQLAGVMTGNETGNLHCRRDNADVKSRETVLFQTYVFAEKCIHMTIC